MVQIRSGKCKAHAIAYFETEFVCEVLLFYFYFLWENFFEEILISGKFFLEAIFFCVKLFKMKIKKK